jgi:hypothetical protein
MWWQKPKPMTEQEREEEIRRLEGVRDRLLNDAPKHFYALRLLLPIMLAMALVMVWHAVWERPPTLTFWAALFLAAFLLVLCDMTWKVWKGTPRDKWGFSDGLGYEGDSPRDIQKKIDALRSTPTAPAQPNRE